MGNLHAKKKLKPHGRCGESASGYKPAETDWV